jgi:hypothetical protein
MLLAGDGFRPIAVFQSMLVEGVNSLDRPPSASAPEGPFSTWTSHQAPRRATTLEQLIARPLCQRETLHISKALLAIWVAAQKARYYRLAVSRRSSRDECACDTVARH